MRKKRMDTARKAAERQSRRGRESRRESTEGDSDVAAMSAKTMRKAIKRIVAENSDEDEWFPLANLGNLILKRYPDFDVRNFGFKKFTPFIKSLGVFEFREERVAGSNNKTIYIREQQ